MRSRIMICGSNSDGVSGRRYTEMMAEATGGEIFYWEDMLLEIRTSRQKQFQCDKSWPVPEKFKKPAGHKIRNISDMIESAQMPQPLGVLAVTVYHKGVPIVPEDYDLALLFGWYGRGRYGSYRDMAFVLGNILSDAGVEIWNKEATMRGYINKTGCAALLARNQILVPDTIFAPNPKMAIMALIPGQAYIIKDVLGVHGDNNYLLDDPEEIYNMLVKRKSMIQAFIPNDHDLRAICFGSELKLLMSRARKDNTTHVNNTTQGGDACWITPIPERLKTISHKIAELTNCDLAGIDYIETPGVKNMRRYWCLEVNVIPQLTSGFDRDLKLQELGRKVREVVAEKDNKK